MEDDEPLEFIDNVLAEAETDGRVRRVSLQMEMRDLAKLLREVSRQKRNLHNLGIEEDLSV